MNTYGRELCSFWLSVMNGLATMHGTNNTNFIFDVAAEITHIVSESFFLYRFKKGPAVYLGYAHLCRQTTIITDLHKAVPVSFKINHVKFT